MRLLVLLAALAALAACSDWLDVPPPPPPLQPALRPLGTFTRPVYVTSPPADLLRLFVVEREGRVRVLRRDTLLARPFLDLRGKIAGSPTDELGLFSIAFHPQYATNGRFFAFYTNLDGDIRVVRYVRSLDPDSADEATGDTVLAVPHPTYGNHHGGQLQFGPDGKLFVSLGDGGCCGDPFGYGQDKHTLNGKLLRLEVDSGSGYRIPADNPFASDTSGAPEIWAYGLRNPWRFSFDRQTGDLYIADVGQDVWEEVNVGPAASEGGKGANYGWSVMEGSHCYPSDPCDGTGLVPPVIEYPHGNGACSVTGGYVYRGLRVAALSGQYLYADYCAGFVRGYRVAGGTTVDWTTRLSPGTQIVSFGEDARGDVYIVTLTGGVYRIVEAP
jgi:hypothetical protein